MTPATGNGILEDHPSDRAALDAYSQAVTRVARELIPSVASLEVRRYLGGRVRRAGAGSAVSLTPDRFLVTSAHVVGGTQGGTATFADGLEVDFEVVGADPLSDLAVIRVGEGELHPVTLGDADQLLVGQLVVAVGNPLGYAGSVSAGVVSALGRSLAAHTDHSGRLIENVIQTDAALHPGNSGGALADSACRVVGINTALIGLGIGQGLGMAIPINATTRQILATLMRDGRIRRAYLGIAGGSRPLPPRAAQAAGRQRGIEILSVVDGSPAAAAGLRPEDIIVTVDGVATDRVGVLQQLMTDRRIGRDVPVDYVRGGQVRRLLVRPTELRS
ncbi:MAG: S1C family serine protease [Egibacteraceae bacterium]